MCQICQLLCSLSRKARPCRCSITAQGRLEMRFWRRVACAEGLELLEVRKWGKEGCISADPFEFRGISKNVGKRSRACTNSLQTPPVLKVMPCHGQISPYRGLWAPDGLEDLSSVAIGTGQYCGLCHLQTGAYTHANVHALIVCCRSARQPGPDVAHVGDECAKRAALAASPAPKLQAIDDAHMHGRKRGHVEVVAPHGTWSEYWLSCLLEASCRVMSVCAAMAGVLHSRRSSRPG
jgi:hypothetical protein